MSIFTKITLLTENKSIELKRKHNIETPDSIIGATAILNKLTLVTRNENDFKNIKHGFSLCF